jgi:hypothetical protein
MADEKVVSLYQEVKSKTEQGRIPWEPTADEYVFIANVKGKYVFEFRPYESLDEDTGEPQGSPSILFKDAERDLLLITSAEANVTWPEMYELYQRAKRQALRVNEKIDDVLGDIRNL